MRNPTQWILMAALATFALPAPAVADTWTVSGAYTSTVRLQQGAHRPQRQRSDGSFDFTAVIAPDGGYEITGPFSFCEGPADGFRPRGVWNGSERAFLEKAVRATVRTLIRGCDDHGPVRVRALSAGVRLAGATLSGRASAHASLRVPIRPPFFGRLTLRGRVTGTRTATPAP
jgi:hypothetical protein